MEKASLTQAKNIIIKALDNCDINNTDKTELILNLWLFLNENKYEDNIQVLKKELHYDNNYSRKR